jgi:hypothetical protein
LIDTQWDFYFQKNFAFGVEIALKNLAVHKCRNNPQCGDFKKIFAVPIKTTSPIPNSMKGCSSGINFDATQQGQSREMALKIMPSTTGVAKSGSVLEPHGTADKKSGSDSEPHSKKR